MATVGMDKAVDDFIDKSDDAPVKTQEEGEEYQPQYRMVADLRIPVSKKLGPLWKSRREAAIAAIKNDDNEKRWDAALRYYRNDQTEKKDESDPDRKGGIRLTTEGFETENVVFANTSSMIPSIYAKNPQIETSAEDEATYGDIAECIKHLVNVIIAGRTSPSVNLKPIAKRSVLMSILTNICYVEVGYTKKLDSNEQSLADLQKIGEKLTNTTDRKELQELEAQLVALEDKVDLLRPSGPWLKFRGPKDVLIDPDATDLVGLSDAKYVVIEEFVDTNFLKVVYGKKNDKGQYESIFKETHVLKLGEGGDNGGVDENLTSFSLIAKSEDKSGKDYGFDNEDAYRKAQRTRVAYVWDKSTRRVFMFNTADWTWPLWVWEDPYEYDDFFPVVPLSFYMDPSRLYARSEVVMYLDQQDAINKINNEIAKCREYIVGKVIFNTNVVSEAAMDSFLSGTTRRRALGVNLPKETDLTKLFMPLMPQSAAALNTAIFDKERLYKSIDNVSSVSGIMRGEQFKTNTTNKAVENYQSRDATRLDEKIDIVEDFIGAIGWKIAQLCIKEMDKEIVQKLIGERRAAAWDNKPSLRDFQTYVDLKVQGGSTTKPTSASKKQDAVQIGQVLGQYGKAVPAAIMVAIKVMERAFDEVVVTREDWEMITQGIQAAMQAQAAQQGGAGAEGQDAGSEDQALQQVEQIVDNLPPPLKAKLGEAIAKGAPVRQAVGAAVQVMQKMKGQQQPQQGAVQ